MAGIDLTNDRRSQLLEQLLKQQTDPRQRPIQSGGELAARLGAQLIRQQQIKKLQGEEKASQQELIDAMSAGQATGPTTPTLEGIEGAFPPEQLAIPGKKADRFASQEALSKLSPQQQLQAMQLQGAQKELAEPGFKDRVAIQTEATAGLQEKAQTAQAENVRSRLDAQQQENKRNRDFTSSENEKNRVQSETNSLRDVQSKFDLEHMKQGAKDAGIGLTEREGKATSWLNQATVGNTIIEEKLNNGFKATPKSVALFSEAIDEKTGNINRQLLRKAGISQEAINFFDASYLIIDPVVRQSTGAAVKQFEFINWFNALIPQSDDPTENEQKSFIRSRLVDGFKIEAGEGGVELFNRLQEKNPIPSFVEGGGELTPAEQAELDELRKKQ